MTQWPFYFAFRLLGPRLSSVRLVTIALFALFLLGYAYATARKYSPGLFFLGMVLLGLQSHLFFYSRIALFAMPVVICVYWLLFLLRRLETAAPNRALGLIFIFAVVSTFGVKAAAPIYITPIIFGFSSRTGSAREARNRPRYGSAWVFLSSWVCWRSSPVAFGRKSSSIPRCWPTAC